MAPPRIFIGHPASCFDLRVSLDFGVVGRLHQSDRNWTSLQGVALLSAVSDSSIDGWRTTSSTAH